MNHLQLPSYCLLMVLSIMTWGCADWNDSVEASITKVKPTAVHFNNQLVSYIQEEINPELIYKVASRFGATITEEQLEKAVSVLDIVPARATDWKTTDFETVTIGVLPEGEISEVVGYKKQLTEQQIQVLQGLECSDDFFIRARGKTPHPATGRPENYAYYFTVVPEQEARYRSGPDALIEHLRANSIQETTVITKDKLRPGRVEFTVTKDGKVRQVRLTASSGYPQVDEQLVELIRKLPDTWYPAINAQGEKVEQELVFFFGLEGC